MEAFTDQGWFQTLGVVVLVANTLTASLPDAWVQKIPVLRTIWPLLNWASINIFNNINHPKGMKASKEVEKEIDEAKAKVRERSGLPDVLDGV
jgi:hypothetical protein